MLGRAVFYTRERKCSLHPAGGVNILAGGFVLYYAAGHSKMMLDSCIIYTCCNNRVRLANLKCSEFN